jgi:menaquinol-cytochrome c reductase iron-sulfur subunit
MNRRILLTIAMSLGGGLLAALVAIPSLLSAISPSLIGRSKERWRAAGTVDQFPLDQVTPATIPVNRGDWAQSLQEKTVYVWRKGPEEFVVYSRNCTDLSCPVTFDTGSECFFCPCHGGIFAKDGTPMAGPPKVPLYRYAYRVQNGSLEIDLSSLPPMT